MLTKSQTSHSINDVHKMCTTCIHGKITRTYFPNESNRCILPFNKVHTYVWGSSSIRPTEGYRYHVVFVDDCTRFVWIFPIFNKLEVFSTFVKFYKFVKVQFGFKIKSLQSDGGGEFISNAFKDFIASNGMTHIVLCPYTP